MSYYQIQIGTVRATGEQIIMAAIRYDANAVAAIKAFPGRRFSPETKRWIVPIAHKAAFTAIVEAAKRRYDDTIVGGKFDGRADYQDGKWVVES
jgi:hypothetical protein